MADPLPLLLIAGVPGCGKTTVVSHLSGAAVISTDDFYLAVDDPLLPHRHGIPDWEAVTAIDLKRLQTIVERLLKHEAVQVPRYDMRQSRPCGQRKVDPKDVCAIVVEGLHAFELQVSQPVCMSRVLVVSPSLRVVFRRLRRDVREGRFSLIESLFQMIPMYIRYRNYNSRRAQIADHILSYEGEPLTLASKIKRCTHYWRNC